MTHPTAAPPVQAQTTIPSVPHVNGVYAVLQALTPGNPLMGGWGYLTWTGSVTHEGLDLNSMGGGDSDLGAAVVAPLDGVVTWVQLWDGWSDGFGTHLAMVVDDVRAAEPCFLHVAHLATLKAQPGQRVVAGQLLGSCGKSGNQGYAHVHASLWHDVPPGGWNFWQVGYSREWVAQHTLDPQDWFWASVAKAQGAPEEAVTMILSGAQTAAVQAAMFGDYWASTAPEFAIPTAWRDRWHEGHWPGRPISAEQPIPPDPSENKPRGFFQLFEHSCCVWLDGIGTSWNG